MGGLIGVAHGEWYRLVTGGFVHANIIHLGMNMWALYVLGRLTEQLFGRSRMVLIYMVSLLAGSVGALLYAPDSLTVGASGAIFGLMGAVLVVAKARGMAMRDTGLLWVLGINLVLTFGLSSYISVGAHIGGLIGGGIAGLLIIDVPMRLKNVSRQGRQRASLAIGVALLVVFFVAGVVVANAHTPLRVSGVASGPAAVAPPPTGRVFGSPNATRLSRSMPRAAPAFTDEALDERRALAAALVEVGRAVRDAVRDGGGDVDADRSVVRHEGGDDVFGIDARADAALRDALVGLEAWPGLLVCEGFDEPMPVGADGRSWRYLADPVDGTRGLLAGTRSAWVLLGAGDGAQTLEDLEVGVAVEIPTDRAALGMVALAVRGDGAHAWDDVLAGGYPRRRARCSRSATGRWSVGS